MAESTIANTNSARNRAIIAGVVGNILEWYDFAIYAFLVPTISKLFFPAGNPTTAILLTLAVFGSGFVARPFGGIVFGFIGDKYGRRLALGLVTICMGFSTFGMGMLPTFQSVGVLAPIMLVVLRLLQGLSSGGEWGGSASLLVEYAPKHRRGLFGSLHLAGTGVGFLIGAGFVSALNAILTSDQILAWGWRVPLLCGVLLVIVGLYLRSNVEETPIYAKAAESGNIADSPIRAAFSEHSSLMLAVFGITVFQAVSTWIFLVYAVTYLVTIAKFSMTSALTINSWGLVTIVIAAPVIGLLSDKVGRKPLLIASCIFTGVAIIPAFKAINTGDYTSALVAQIVMTISVGAYAGVLPTFLVELFPTRIRYSGLSIAYNFAQVLLGGFAPFIAQFLATSTGNPISTTYYVIAAAAVSLVFVLKIKETAFSELQ